MREARAAQQPLGQLVAVLRLDQEGEVDDERARVRLDEGDDAPGCGRRVAVDVHLEVARAAREALLERLA